MEHKDNNHYKSIFPDENTIDFGRFFSLFISNWYWFVISLFIGITLAYGINRYSEKVYTVTSSLLVKDSQFGGGTNDYNNIFQGIQMYNGQQNLKNEIGILKSFSLNKRVIDSLPEFQITYVRVGRRNIVERRLYKDSPFIVLYDTEISQTPTKVNVRITKADKCIIQINGEIDIEETINFGEEFNKYGYSFKIERRNPNVSAYDERLSNKYAFWFNYPVNLANHYRRAIQINPIDEAASLINLSLSGAVAKQEADYLDKLMYLYIVQGLELKNQTADSTISFINTQLEQIYEKLTYAEKELEEFRRYNRLIDLSNEGTIIQSKIEKYESEKSIIELQKDYYEYLLDYLKSRDGNSDIISPSVMGVTDQLLINLIKNLSVLQQKKDQYTINLQEETAPIYEIQEEIRKVKKAIQENLQSGMSKINTSLMDINKRISDVEVEINKLPGIEQELIRIQRKFDINNTVYTYLLEKQAETGIAKASNVADNRIIDKASGLGGAIIKPKIKKNYTMGFILGLLFPTIFIILVDIFNNKIIDKRDVEKGTDAPMVGYISHNDKKSEIPVYDNPGSTLAEAFRSVRTNISYFLLNIDNPVIAVSSTISSEGKTFTSINLATIISMLGKKVLLVGLDLRKPRIHKVLEVENGIGMSTFLSGGSKFDEIIQPTEIQNLFYVPSGPIPPNPAELIATDKMKEFIEAAKKEFDYIILDTPPIAIVTDALLVSSEVDLYLLVVRQRYTSKDTLPLIQDLYKNNNIKNLGIIINDISQTGYYGYGLRYGYYTGYGYSYGYRYYDAGNYKISRNNEHAGYYND